MTAGTGYTIAIDTGGTFTDLVIDTGEALRLHKAPTTPGDPARGILDVIAAAADGLGVSRRALLADTDLLIHGTTHAINALITHTTARTAFLTTRGHPDVLLFREGGRSDPFDFSVPYPEPLVPRALTFEVPGRIASDGSEREALDEPEVLEIIEQLKAQEVEAVGVCLLWSIVAPAHERRVGELIAEHLPGVPVTLSHALNPSIREYRRASSTCIDASLKPLMSSYFAGLDERLAEAGFAGRLLIVTSQGGTLDAADVAAAPIHAINSGPAMAPVAGRHYTGLDTGIATAIIADTGGTTFDVSLVRDGHIPRTSETWLGPQYQGHITGFPSVDVTSVGAGGGSIAAVDEAGLLCVGPESAGSEPGPACYGRGGVAATVTDACLVLGYIDPEYFLAGRMPLDAEAAAAALHRDVADRLGLDLHAAALAVMRVATENMVGAIEQITINQGIDPRDAVLVGGGGAAGLNLVAIARQLGCRRVLLPETGAALSAAGALLSDLSADYAATALVRTDSFEPDRVGGVLAGLRSSCEAFAARSRARDEPRIELSFDGRYLRQNWDLEAPIADTAEFSADALAEEFHRIHQRVFAISEPGSPVLITTWRARVNCRISDIGGRRLADPGSSSQRPRRRVMFGGGQWHDTAVLAQSAIGEREIVSGPAIIESPFTTLVLDPGMVARRTASGSLLIEATADGPS
jgi:N-methylhydantoinase A